MILYLYTIVINLYLILAIVKKIIFIHAFLTTIISYINVVTFSALD